MFAPRERTRRPSPAVVHAREAVMAGLSPKSNREVPPLRPELAARLARELGDYHGGVRVTLNGGVASVTAAGGALMKWPGGDGWASIPPPRHNINRLVDSSVSSLSP